MSFTIAMPEDTDKFAVVSGILTATGRSVTFTASSGLIACPACGSDDPFCPECQGHGKIDQLYTHEAIASVRWRTSDKKMYRPQGQEVEGDLAIVVLLQGNIEEVIRQTRFVTVDDRQCVVDGWHREGAPPNRIYIALNEDTDLGGTRIG
jgi:hypothetical protein